MPIVKKAPGNHDTRSEAGRAGQRATRRLCSIYREHADHVINSVLKKVLWRDQDYRKWRDERRTPARRSKSSIHRRRAGKHDAANLESRAFIAAIFAMAIGAICFTQPFLEHQVFLRVISDSRSTSLFEFQMSLLRVPVHDALPRLLDPLSGIYIFTLKPRRTISAGPLPQYPDPAQARRMSLVVGRSPQSPKGDALEDSLLAHDSRAWIVYRNRDVGRYGEWQN